MIQLFLHYNLSKYLHMAMTSIRVHVLFYLPNQYIIFVI